MKKILLIFSSLLVLNISFANDLFLTQEEIREADTKFENLIQSYGVELNSGDIVGNGAGLAELNLAYTYKKLPGFIKRCLTYKFCYRNSQNKRVLEKIKRTIENKAQSNKVFLFVRENAQEIFSDHDEQRIAMTGFSSKHPILINKKALYEDEDLVQNIPRQSSILIHELGHQIGISSHKYLDYLSALVQSFLELNYDSYFIEVNAQELRVNLFSNHKSEWNIPVMNINFNHKNYDLTDLVESTVLCEKGDKMLLSYDLNNLHWGHRPVENETQLELNFWAKVVCLGGNNITKTYEKDYQLKVLINDKNLLTFRLKSI